MPPVDSYLLYLSFLDSTGLVHWAAPAKYTAETPGIIARNMNRAEKICTRIPSIPRYNQVFAGISINHESSTLENSHVYLTVWEHNWKDYEDGYRKQQINTKLANLERALHTRIRNYNKGPEGYAAMLSKWAALAAEFPSFQVTNTISKQQCSLSEYWQDLITACVKKDAVLFLDSTVKKDLEELIEHVETYLPATAVYAKELYDLLRSGREKQTAFFGLGDLDLTASRYRIIHPSGDGKVDVEAANKIAMIDSAPSEKPVESRYPSKIAFLRAKLKWDMAVEYRKQEPAPLEPVQAASPGTSETVGGIEL